MPHQRNSPAILTRQVLNTLSLSVWSHQAGRKLRPDRLTSLPPVSGHTPLANGCSIPSTRRLDGRGQVFRQTPQCLHRHGHLVGFQIQVYSALNHPRLWVREAALGWEDGEELGLDLSAQRGSLVSQEVARL